MASKYLSALRAFEKGLVCGFTRANRPRIASTRSLKVGALEGFDQGVAMGLQDLFGPIEGQLPRHDDFV